MAASLEVLYLLCGLQLWLASSAQSDWSTASGKAVRATLSQTVNQELKINVFPNRLSFPVLARGGFSRLAPHCAASLPAGPPVVAPPVIVAGGT